MQRYSLNTVSDNDIDIVNYVVKSMLTSGLNSKADINSYLNAACTLTGFQLRVLSLKWLEKCNIAHNYVWMSEE